MTDTLRPVCSRASSMCGPCSASTQLAGRARARPTPAAAWARGRPSLVAEAGRGPGEGIPPRAWARSWRVSTPQGLAPAVGPQGVSACPHIHAGAGPVPGGPPALSDEAEVTWGWPSSGVEGAQCGLPAVLRPVPTAGPGTDLSHSWWQPSAACAGLRGSASDGQGPVPARALCRRACFLSLLSLPL